jgi:hypothetical protein
MKIKALIIIAISVFAPMVLTAQDYSKLENIVLKEKPDYPKNENLVLECSNYLLNSPIESLDKDLNHLRALQFIMRWMEGTPDYKFSLDESIVDVTKSNSTLLGIYMSCMSKFVIENKDKSKDQAEIKYNSFITFIRYCEDPARNVKQSKKIKELIKAKNENTLREYLKIDNNQEHA